MCIRDRRIHKPVDGPSLDGLEQTLGGVHVVRRVDQEVAAPALSYPRLGCQVEDVGDAVEKGLKVGGLERGLDERELLVSAQLGEVLFLDLAGVIVREAVEARD